MASNDPGFGRIASPAMQRRLRQMNGGYRTHDPGFQAPSQLIAALLNARRAPELVSEHGRTRPVPTPQLMSENGGIHPRVSVHNATLQRNLINGPTPTPHAPVAQVGVSPINRTMPAAVLNSTAPPGVQNSAVGMADRNYAPLENAGQVAAGTAAPVYAPNATASPSPSPSFGAPQPQFESHPAMLGGQATEGVHPALSLLLQALAARTRQMPGGFGGRLV